MPNPFHGRPRHGCLSSLLWLVLLGIIGLMVVRMVPLTHATAHKVPELVAFVPFCVLPCAVIVVFAFLWRRRLLAPASAVCLVILLVWHAGYFMPHLVSNSSASHVSSSSTQSTNASNVAVSSSTHELRVMTLNTAHGYADAASVVSTVRIEGVQVLALQEVTQGFIERLQAAGINDVLPYHVSSRPGASDNGGFNCLFSATELSQTNGNLVPTEMSAFSAANVGLGNTALRFVSVHPNSPHKGGQTLWNEGLWSIEKLSGYDHAYVIMGDFNATWDHALFRQLLGTRFVDAGEQAGEGFHMTYPSNSKLPPVIEIDHIVYSKNAGITARHLKTVQIPGSDHRALLATLTVK